MKLTALITIGLLLAGNPAQAVETLPRGILTLDGQDAPALQLLDINGSRFDLEQTRGKWVFVHFWASWCGPCRREMPTIQAVANSYRDSGLQIVMINTAEDEDTIFSFMAVVAPDLNTLLDSDGLVTERWQPRGLPSTYFVDPQGKLRYVALGGRPWDEPVYREFLDQLAASVAGN